MTEAKRESPEMEKQSSKGRKGTTVGESGGLGQPHRMGRKRCTSQKNQRASEDNRENERAEG